MTEVKVGQIWKDNDKRHPTRLVEIVSISSDKASVINPETGKKSKIRLDRFKPNATGYILVKDV